ncbi:TPA: helix-turn-helix transcriptional regulator [Streptococcus equi subsp. zooepidemicus]|nr:helix-turn-helix transcriptional regulator [Streptococcus equi subsp. zooepidemicus]HEL1230451.1 helix-turn-helix transcriptional regulator [Streptococcus equi subsp. zooepidemicus]
MVKSNVKGIEDCSKKTQKELSALTGISVRTLARYEKDVQKLRRAKYEKLRGIAEALTISVDDIFLGDDSDFMK